MLSNSHDFIRPADEAERVFLESLIRADYDRCHPARLRRHEAPHAYSARTRALPDWMVIAAARAEALRPAAPIRAAA